MSAGPQADMDALAAFEEQAGRDLNEGLFFKSLYKPTVTAKRAKPRLTGAAQRRSAAAELESIRRVTRAQAEQPVQYITYGSAALSTLLLLSLVTQAPGRVGALQVGIATLLGSAALFQLWLSQDAEWRDPSNGEVGGTPPPASAAGPQELMGNSKSAEDAGDDEPLL